METLHSKIHIKNIAICMYGQYRTGDACLEYIKKFYNSDDINVDYFCSLKTYETTYTRHIHNEKINKKLWEKEIVDKDILEYQKSQIFKYLTPVAFKIYSLDYEQQLADAEGSLIHSKVLAGWTDAVMLKQQYEADNDITYDLVIMQRYDVITWPSYAFSSILSNIQGLETSYRGTLSTGDKNVLFVNPIDFIRPTSGVFMYPNGQDLWTIGVGTALDTFVYDALEHIPSAHISNFSLKEFHNGYPYTDTHEMVGAIVNKMNIPKSMLPSVTTNGGMNLPLQNIQHGSVPYKTIAPIVIRNSYWDKNEMPNLVDLSDDELEKLYDEVIFTKWHTGY
tara:strand:- start:3034 stop:4041 length:1008 start_codon:yes stop_codon:yes gene_type:complete